MVMMMMMMMKELFGLYNFTSEHSPDHSEHSNGPEHSPGSNAVKGFGFWVGLRGLSPRAAAETLRWLKTME